MPANENITMAMHKLKIGFFLLIPDKSLKYSTYRSLVFRDKITVKIPTFISK